MDTKQLQYALIKKVHTQKSKTANFDDGQYLSALRKHISIGYHFIKINKTSSAMKR